MQACKIAFSLQLAPECICSKHLIDGPEEMPGIIVRQALFAQVCGGTNIIVDHSHIPRAHSSEVLAFA